MKALLDTSVISELVSKKPNPKVVEFVDSLDAGDVFLSVITVGDMVKGIEKHPSSRRRSEQQAWFNDDLLVRLEGNVVPLDIDIMAEWGRITARLESKGKTMPVIDSLVAATVLDRKMTLATRNVSDFEGTDAETVNPWE